MRKAKVALWCGGLMWAALAAHAQNPHPIPADPTGKPNQMITDCMEKQDPAMNKEDAAQACKDKMKQGIKVDKPKKPRPKPNEEAPGK